MKENHKILYTSISSIVIFLGITYSVDYFLTIKKPYFIKNNGKIDKNKQILYTLLISFLIFMVIFLIIYQLFI
jgi:hypothetical protein